jgi:class 3 adenylate cyclase
VWTAGAELVDSSVAPNGVLRLVNPAAAPVTFVVETAAWLELALRPGKLVSFQTFRDLFSKDYLATGVQLAVGEQTILFTDLVGSTAMYEERGDPAAFVAVKQHFDRVFAIIGENRGAVVKTIGDAVMGAFNDPVDAVKAARAIHAAFPPSDNGLRLRISINTGPCIAVRFNASVDYFGHAVNVAAKLQALAEGWQIAISERTADDPRVAAWLAEQSTDLERVELELKGLGPQRARRWTVTD